MSPARGLNLLPSCTWTAPDVATYALDPEGMRETTDVLVVDDEPDMIALYRHFFAAESKYAVTYCQSSQECRAAVEQHRYDVLVSDFHLPNMDGLQLGELLKTIDPQLPMLLVTAYPSLDAAVRALRSSASDFLTKPLQRDELFAAVDRAAASRAAHSCRVLAIGAHPDDVEIGAGATLAQHAAAGDQVTILTASRGRHGGDPVQRSAEAQAAATLLGARLILGDLEDTAIPKNGPTIALIEQAIADVAPDVVYVHSANDVHQDHRAVHAATRIAARRVSRILCYQSPSATIEFRPTVFIPVTTGLTTKLAAIEAFASQVSIRDYLAPDMLTATARYWGRYGQATYAEPFEVLRERTEVHRVSA